MVINKPPSIWQGREDEEEAPWSLRWHHRVLPLSYEGEDVSQDRGLIGFCCDAGVSRNHGRIGAAEGPMALRDQLRNIAWHKNDCLLIDFGDVEVTNGELELGQQHLAEQVTLALSKVDRLLVVGGGHETAYGSFCGLHKALGAESKIGIINLDAHFDLRRPSILGPSSGTPFFQIHSLIGPEKFHYCCLGVSKEANTDALFKRADKWGVRYRTDTEMRREDLAQISYEIQSFAQQCDALYLTIDMDVLPHYQAPGVSAPAVRGVSLDVVEAVIDQVINCAKYCRFGLPLVELTELNPTYDQQGVTARTAALLAKQLLKDT